MADQNRDEQLRLEEVDSTALPEELEPGPLGERMERLSAQLQSMPTAAQLVLLRTIVPELLEQLDANDRAYWAREIVGEGVPEIPTFTV